MIVHSCIVQDYFSLELRGGILIFVSLTFDDGNEVQYKKFYPVLREHGIKATFYIVTSQINWPGKMNYDEIVDLYRNGNEIGSHTHTHPHLTKLSDNKLDFELRMSKAALDRFECRTLSYPYGEYNRRVIDNAKKYYIAARGYYDPITQSRSYGYNFDLNKERYRLNVFSTEHTFPPYNSPLLRRPFQTFKEIIKNIIENRNKERTYTIFAFHGKTEAPLRNIAWTIYKRRCATVEFIARIQVLSGMEGWISNTIFEKNELLKFRWMCEYLASNNSIETLTVLEAVNKLQGYDKE